MVAITEHPQQAPGRWSKLAPLCGLLFVLFVLGSVFAANVPDSGASTVSILHYYRTHKNQVLISALLIPPAVVFGLIWFSYLRTWLQRRDVDQPMGHRHFRRRHCVRSDRRHRRWSAGRPGRLS